jgi:hypothetical protein
MPPIFTTDEGVPLDKDVIVSEKKFTIGFYEFLNESGEQKIIHSELVNGGFQLFFTVPEKKTLYITNASISAGWIGDTGGEEVRLRIGNPNAENFLMEIFPRGDLPLGGNDTQNVAQTFTIPFKVESGGELFHDNASNADSSIIVIGFLIDKKISFI